MSDDYDDPPLTETERVQRQRTRLLVEGGYPIERALKLANRADVDVHRAIDLLAHECPLETAMEILL